MEGEGELLRTELRRERYLAAAAGVKSSTDLANAASEAESARAALEEVGTG